MPIRNWGGGGDYSDTFLALQDQFLREAQAARDRALAASRATSGGGSGGGGGGRSSRGSRTPAETNAGARGIVDRIAAGQANWQELYNYYKDQQKQYARSSSMYQQLGAQIANIEYIVEANGLDLEEATAPKIRYPDEAGPAVGILDDDDVLTSDVIDLINEQVLYMTTVRNGIYPDGDDPVGSFLNQGLIEGTVEELRDTLIADAKMYDRMLEDIEAGRGSFIIDPTTNAWIEVEPDNIMNIIYDAYNTRYQLLGIERGLGDTAAYNTTLDQIQGMQKRVGSIVSNQVFPAPDPTTGKYSSDIKGVQGYLDNMYRGVNLLRNTALASGDPYDAIATFAAAGGQLRNDSLRIKKYLESLPDGIDVDPEIMEQLDYNVELGMFYLSARQGDLAPDEMADQWAELVDKRPSSYYLTADELIDTGGEWGSAVGGDADSGPKTGWSGIVGAIVAREGLKTSALRRDGREGEIVSGVEAYTWVARYGEQTPVAVPESAVAEYLGIDGNFKQGTFPSIEKVTTFGGRTETTVVWRQMRPLSEVSNTKWYYKVDANGNPVFRNGDVVWATQAEYESFGSSVGRMRAAGFAEGEVPVLQGLLTVVGQDGETYYTTNEATGVFANIPVDKELDGPFTIPMLIDSEGNIRASYRPDNGQYALVGRGVSRRDAQQVLMSAAAAAEIDLSVYSKVDDFGVPLPDEVTLEDAEDNLWSVSDESMFIDRQYKHRNHARLKEHYAAARRQRLLGEAKDIYRESFLSQQATQPSALRNPIEETKKASGIHFGIVDRFAQRQELPAPTLPKPEPVAPLTPNDLGIPKPKSPQQSRVTIR